MKTAYLACLSVLLININSLFAQDIQNQIIDEAMSVLRENLDDIDVSSCYNLSRSDFEAKFKNSLRDFFKEEGNLEYVQEEFEFEGQEAVYNSLAPEVSDYAYNKLLVDLNIDEDEYYECQERLARQTYESQISNLNDGGALGDYLKNMGGAISNEDVGLPVYENSSLVSYMNEQQSEEMLKEMFPDIKGPFMNAVIYFSYADFNDIVAFYEKELDGFRKGSIDEQSIGFTAEDYDFKRFTSLEGVKKWSTLESVWIEKFKSSNDGKVKIEIHWK